MLFLLKIARQPIFQFLAIIIVLILTDMRPSFGITAAVLLFLWIAVARSPLPELFSLIQTFRNM